MNGHFDLFREPLSGIDLADMVFCENDIIYTNTINGMEFSPVPSSDGSLTVDDFKALNDIISEIVELNENSDETGQESKLASANGRQSQLDRFDSINMALGDYSLSDFDLFETTIQMNDPMLGIDILNKRLNVF